MTEEISFNDFKQLDIKIGTITAAEEIDDADSLLKLTVDVGEEEPRTLVAGIKDAVEEPDAVVDMQVPVLCNLEPKEMFGVESQGMMLIAKDDEHTAFLNPSQAVDNGASIQ